jgi:hypothetical protein
MLILQFLNVSKNEIFLAHKDITAYHICCAVTWVFAVSRDFLPYLEIRKLKKLNLGSRNFIPSCGTVSRVSRDTAPSLEV